MIFGHVKLNTLVHLYTEHQLFKFYRSGETNNNAMLTTFTTVKNPLNTFFLSFAPTPIYRFCKVLGTRNLVYM
jgi:hypothetical protein